MSRTTLLSTNFHPVKVSVVRRRQHVHPICKKIEDYNEQRSSQSLPLASIPATHVSNKIIPTLSSTTKLYRQEKKLSTCDHFQPNEINNRTSMINSIEDPFVSMKHQNSWKKLKHFSQPLCCMSPKKRMVIFIVPVLLLILGAVVLPSILVFLLQSGLSHQTYSSVYQAYTNHCEGVSPWTLWQNDSVSTITMNINTSGCHFQITPLYFTSIFGLNVDWDLMGYGAIYYPTNVSFHIYARSLSGLNAMQTYANSGSWNVAWVGATKEQRTYFL